MEAHGEDLRAESHDDALVEAVKKGSRTAPLPPRMAALAAYAEKLTLHPSRMTEADMALLRTAGLTDTDILDAVQVIAYFNYINRVADGLGVDLEPEMPPRPDRVPRRGPVL